MSTNNNNNVNQSRPFSRAEDAAIIDIKENGSFVGGWAQLAIDFNARFPGVPNREWGTMQVRYSRYIQAGKKHRDAALAYLAANPYNSPPPPPAATAPVPAQPAPAATAPPAAIATPPLPVVSAAPQAPPVVAAVPQPAPPPPPAALVLALPPAAAPWDVPAPQHPANRLYRLPRVADFGHGLPDEPSPAARLAADAAWERAFDRDLADVRAERPPKP